ncbi:MAG TPA: TetR/AcrR family transcriptional regulator [Dongiaceae bacterium]|nr:TetR/AcrR family transcriptional regulator [Dongiaceae bacterium]
MPSRTLPSVPKERRELLLDAALALFTEQPFDTVSLADIANRAGVAYGLIGHYFGGKRGIYLASMEAMANRLRAVRDQDPPAGQDAVDALRLGVARHIAYLESQAAGFTALMRGGLGADPDVRQIVATLRWEGAERVLNLLGAKRPLAPLLRTAMHGWVGLLDEAVLDWLEHRDLEHAQLAAVILNALSACLLSVGRDTTGIADRVVKRIGQS